MKATVFGAGGFVGSHLVEHLRRSGYVVDPILRGDASWRGRPLGHAFYCVGLTADFRRKPMETIDAHVTFATEILREGRFDSFLYLSSTRVYSRAAAADEAATLPVDPAAPGDLYNISKLAGEAACLSLRRPEIRVARLSNVFGADFASENFLTSILRDAVDRKAILLGTSLESEKDYVWVEDVVHALERIARSGTLPIYNIGSGRNTAHREIVQELRNATGCAVAIAPEAPTTSFPRIEVARLAALGTRPFTPVTAKIETLVAEYRSARKHGR